MNRHIKIAQALTSAALMAAVLGGCASASESTSSRPDESSLIPKADKPSLTVARPAANPFMDRHWCWETNLTFLVCAMVERGTRTP
ncbi:MAG: hypothetical protein U0174_13880 [Polyangiaceae bacterium]